MTDDVGVKIVIEDDSHHVPSAAPGSYLPAPAFGSAAFSRIDAPRMDGGTYRASSRDFASGSSLVDSPHRSPSDSSRSPAWVDILQSRAINSIAGPLGMRAEWLDIAKMIKSHIEEAGKAAKAKIEEARVSAETARNGPFGAQSVSINQPAEVVHANAGAVPFRQVQLNKPVKTPTSAPAQVEATPAAEAAAPEAAAGFSLRGFAAAHPVLAIGALTVAAVGAAKAVQAYADRTVEAGERLKYVSVEIAAASARQRIRELQGDVKEARQLGPQYVGMMDEWGEIKQLIREILLPIKGLLMSIVTEGLKDLKAILQIVGTIVTLIENAIVLLAKMSGIYYAVKLGQWALEKIRDAVAWLQSWVMGSKDDDAGWEMFQQFIRSDKPNYDKDRPRDPVWNAAEQLLGIPAFAGVK